MGRKMIDAMMDHSKSVLLTFICWFIVSIAIAQQCPIIPLPNNYQKQSGEFIINKHTPLISRRPEFEVSAVFLQRQLLLFTGIGISRQVKYSLPPIYLEMKASVKGKEGGYKLNITQEKINIEAATQEGMFNGVVSLLQLIRQGQTGKAAVGLQCWQIEDSPKFAWRGLLLDEARHFFGKKKVKQLLDWMAFYKLNRFHWHLTDNQGWRLEIRKYPLLNQVGGIGNLTNPYAAATYYTQDDIKEIVDYAKERCIEVIPEVDMPGHARASNKAYPKFSGGGSARFPDFTFNPGKEETYSYLTDILREVNVLFPSKLMFLGGDEVSLGNHDWNVLEPVQTLMKQKNLSDLKAVEKYFLQRMADSVYAMGNKVLVWDEATDSKLPTDKTIVFWWRHERPEQLKIAFDKGYQVVLCPRLPYYLDFVQQEDDHLGRKWTGKEYSSLENSGKEFNSLENVYNFSLKGIASPAQAKRVLGIQGNVWTETIKNEQRLDYMLFPRITALAESAWTNEHYLDFVPFKERLNKHLIYFEASGLYYFRSGRSEN